MIVSFTGAQSSGKTTLLKHLHSTLLNGLLDTYNFVPEVTRLVSRKYGVDINEEGDDITQYLIVSEHIKNYLKYKNKNAVLDRCIIDGYVYTTYLYNIGKVSLEQLEVTKQICYKLLEKGYLDIVFYTCPDLPLEDDGIRSIDTNFRDQIVSLFDQSLNEFKNKFNINVVNLSGTVEKRIETIYNTIKNYESN